jgi:hypothetical protein
MTTTWPHLFSWPSSRDGERVLRLEADAAERTRIAQRLGLESVESLTARLVVRPWLDGAQVEGEVHAQVGRLCGVTLDPLKETVREDVLMRFAPPGSPNLPPAEAREVVVDPQAEDPPEPGLDQGIDLAGLVEETLALGLEPFPRKPDATFEPPVGQAEASPFAALAALRRGVREPD